MIGPGAVWSDDGETWHLPLDTANARLSGTFGEAFHANIHNGIDFGSQAPGGNICGGSVRAPRSGVLTRVDAAGHHTVELRHPNADPAAQRTRYLHMQPSPPLAFQLGTYINQGTRIGDMGNAPGGTTPCHLHMEAWNDNETQSFNPLALAGNPIAATFGWAPEAFGAPTLNQLYLRRDRRLDAKNTGINGTTYILARTIQRYPTPGGNRLAPYRVQFFVNDQLLCDNFNGQLQCGIQFDALTWPLLPNKGTEALYYAYDTENRCFPADSNNCGNFNPPGQPPNKDLYLMYFRWPTWQLAQNLFAGPQTVRVVSSDYYGNSGERTMVIGPWLTASDDSVTVPGAVNSSEPGATVNIHIQNYNQNIEGQNRDTYSLSVQSNGPVVGLSAANITVNNLDAGNFQIFIGSGQGGVITVTATSGIVHDIKHSVTINVTAQCTPGFAQPSTGNQWDNPAPADSCTSTTVYPWLYYTPTIISRTNPVGLVSIGNGVSVNATGTVAFVGQLPGGNGLFVGDGPDSARNINPAFSANPNRDFGTAVQINNAGRVIARDRVSGSPPRTFIRLWDANVTNAYTMTASGGGPSDPYDAVMGPPTVNNNSQAAFAALRGTQSLLVTSTVSSGTPLEIPIRPMIADDGQVVLHTTTSNLSAIRLYTSTLASYQTIAISGTNWLNLGRNPGLSDDGQIVVFYGDLTAAGATALNNQQMALVYPTGAQFQPIPLSPGPGIFASISTTAGRIIQRVAGLADGFSSFDSDSRVGVNATQGSQRAVTIVYIAYDISSPTPKKGLYTQRLSFFGTGEYAFNPIQPGSFVVISPTLVTRQDQSIDGLPGTIQDLHLYDPVNNRDRGDVAFWVSTSTGAQAVIRARPREVVYLDFNPIARFGVSPYAKQVFDKLGVTATWYGTMGNAFAALAPDRPELIANIGTIQNEIVDRVQAMFDDVDPARAGNQAVQVKVLGRAGEAPPSDGPFTHVYIGDGPFSDANPSSITGAALGDAFNRNAVWQGKPTYLQASPLVFVDNIFRIGNRYFTNEQGSTSIAIGLNDSGPWEITVAQIENAIASTIAHEVGHTLGPAHLDTYLNALIMNQDVSSPLTDGSEIDELRYAQVFTNSLQPLSSEFDMGGLENSSARLAFAVGSDIAPAQLPREPPGAAVLALQSEVKLRLGGSSAARSAGISSSVPTTGSVTVADAVLGIVPGGQSDALPILIDLGTGDLLNLLDTFIPAGEHDHMFLIGSTSGTGIDVFGTTHGFTGDVGAIDLADGLLPMAVSDLQGDLLDEAGEPVVDSL
ncbi:MAG: M23 family metallopeptidase, partial [Anaerolineae bacterium]